MRIVKLLQRNTSRRKCLGYLFNKFDVTAPKKRLRSLRDKIFRSAAKRFLMFRCITMRINMKAFVARNRTVALIAI